MSQYMVCEFSKKAQTFYYVGRVVREVDEEGDIEVGFLRRKGRYFVKPSIEDISSVHMSSVKAILPDPAPRGTSERTKGILDLH